MILEDTELPPSKNPPDWDKWLNIPNIPLYVGIALSLDMDPEMLESELSPRVINQYGFILIDEFKDRIEVATNNLIDIDEDCDSKDAKHIVKLVNFVQWAKLLKWALPPRLIKILNTKMPSDIDDLLSSSKDWQEFNSKVTSAIQAFPEWRSKQRKVQKTGNLMDWLTTEFNANNREAEIIKNIVSDIFINNDKYQ
ncbi:MAG: hypothetical protein AB2689_27495 [Candidatus Thiodiazotropha taylori]